MEYTTSTKGLLYQFYELLTILYRRWLVLSGGSLVRVGICLS